MCIQVPSEAALSKMQATSQWGPLLTLVVPRQPDQVVACAGEGSTEAEYQARREAVNVRTRHSVHQALHLMLTQVADNLVKRACL